MPNQALSVLLVDNDLTFYRLIRQMIAGLNYHIQLAAVKKALQAIDPQRTFNAYILDCPLT